MCSQEPFQRVDIQRSNEPGLACECREAFRRAHLTKIEQRQLATRTRNAVDHHRVGQVNQGSTMDESARNAFGGRALRDEVERPWRPADPSMQPCGRPQGHERGLARGECRCPPSRMHSHNEMSDSVDPLDPSRMVPPTGDAFAEGRAGEAAFEYLDGRDGAELLCGEGGDASINPLGSLVLHQIVRTARSNRYSTNVRAWRGGPLFECVRHVRTNRYSTMSRSIWTVGNRGHRTSVTIEGARVCDVRGNLITK